MASIPLTIRDRFSLVGRAISGQLSLDPTSVGGRLLGGVIQSGGQPPPRGTREFLESYKHLPWLRTVTSRISCDVAATDWQPFVERRGGRAVRNRILQRAKAPQRHVLLKAMVDAGELEPLADHPLIDLLADFNSVHTGQIGRQTTQLHLELAGEAHWLLELGALGQPVAIWPVPPHWILGTPTPRYPFYRVSFRGWQGTIPASEFISFVDVDPANPYGRGVGPAQALADELETDEYAAKHLKSFYFNRARPDLVVWPKGGEPLQESEVRRLEENWTRHSGGFWRAFRPFFLRREVEIKELEQNFRSQQLVQLREFERQTIIEVLGVPPEVLGIVDKGSNRATVNTSYRIYQRNVLIPRLERLRSIMQERLVPLLDPDGVVILDYVRPESRDEDLELDAIKAAPWAAMIDELRAFQGLPPLANDAGKVHLLPFNLTPVRDFDEGASQPPPSLPPGGPPLPDDDDDDDEAPERAMKAFRPQAEQDARACTEAGDRDAARLIRKFARQRGDGDDPAPTRVADRLAAGYRRSQEMAWQALSQRADVGAIEAAIATNNVDDIVAAYGGAGAIAAALTDVLHARGRTAFLRGAELALNDLPPVQAREPISINLADVNPEATRWAEREAATLVQASAQAQESIRTLIVLSNELGITPREVARIIVRENIVGLLPRQAAAVHRFRARLLAEGLDVATVARRAERYAAAQLRLRAWTIARTELVSAVNAGQDALWQVAKQRGILPAGTKRVWLVTLDDLLDENVCEPLTDAEAGLDEPFEPGGFMRPPAHPNCRCAIGIKSVPVSRRELALTAERARRRLVVDRDTEGRVAGLSEDEG